MRLYTPKMGHPTVKTTLNEIKKKKKPGISKKDLFLRLHGTFRSHRVLFSLRDLWSSFFDSNLLGTLETIQWTWTRNQSKWHPNVYIHTKCVENINSKLPKTKTLKTYSCLEIIPNLPSMFIMTQINYRLKYTESSLIIGLNSRNKSYN